MEIRSRCVDRSNAEISQPEDLWDGQTDSQLHRQKADGR